MKKIISIIGIIFIAIIILAVGTAKDEGSSTWDSFDDKTLKSNIERAFQESNMDSNKIKTIAKISDWNNGNRYLLNYDGTTVYIYTYDDGQIVKIVMDSLAGQVVYENNETEIKNNITSSQVVQENNETEKKDNSTKDIITIKYGELGEYGKYDTFGDKKFIRYYLPNGEYKVTALIRNSMLFVVGKEIYTNSFGYKESKTEAEIILNNVGDSKYITITDNNCIELTMNTSISLEKL